MNRVVLVMALWATLAGAEEANRAAPQSTVDLSPGQKEVSRERPVLAKDPFLSLLSSERQQESWVASLMSGDYANAVRTWPSGSSSVLEASRIYLFWKLGLAQTFVDAWIKKLAEPAFRQSKYASALDQLVAPDLDSWLMDTAVFVSPAQEEILSRLPLDQGTVYITLRAWTLLRKGEKAVDVLKLLPPKHRMKPLLAETASLALEKKGDLTSAAKMVEPSAPLLAARLLFQAGAWDEAQRHYERVPRNSPGFRQAREEMSWILLRKQDQERLRGELVTLSSKVFENRFHPEVYVLKAISDLKLCYFGAVEKDLKDFLRIHKPWGQRIDEALKAEEPFSPEELDYYSELAVNRVKQREDEARKISKLDQTQILWVDSNRNIAEHIQNAKRARSWEFKRQWKNRRILLSEAIRKMQRVKTELFKQVQEYAKVNAPGAAENSINVKKEPGQIEFPFDGVPWPDELFKLRSTAQSRCLQRRGK